MLKKVMRNIQFSWNQVQLHLGRIKPILKYGFLSLYYLRGCASSAMVIYSSSEFRFCFIIDLFWILHISQKV